MNLEKLLIRVTVLVGCILVCAAQPYAQKKSPSKLLSEGTYFQSINDVSDRAADRYRQLIGQFPNSKEAERAQFYLGTYYEKKFYILENQNGVQDWSSFNEAEIALKDYVKKYEKLSSLYLADAYHSLAMIAFRRGDQKRAADQLDFMQRSAFRDRIVNIYRVVWSPDLRDVVRRDCDSKALAEKTRDAVWKGGAFSDAVRYLRDWCNQACRRVPS